MALFWEGLQSFRPEVMVSFFPSAQRESAGAGAEL